MAELGLTPSEVELIVPKFVITDREVDIKYWKDQMVEAKSKMTEEVQEVSFGDISSHSNNRTVWNKRRGG